MKKNFFIIAAVVCGMSCTTTAYAQFKIGGKKINVTKVVQAGTDAVKAISLSDADIAAMSKEYMEWMDTHNPLTKPDTDYGKRLEKLTGNIKEVDGLKVNFGVYEVIDVNAFACGDGSVRICAGLMDIMTDDEVMAVVGHEIGHVIHTDSKDAMKNAYLRSAVKNAAGAASSTVVRAQQMSELENQIDSLLNGKKATVGIAVWTDKGDMLRYNDHVHFPLLSVFKFHVALAVLDKMDKQSISLDSIVSIKASQMPPNTYSPLRKKFPDQDFTITLRELMQYSISQSDNNACDILIEYAGGIKHINDYIHRLSIDSFNLSETEDGMHSSFEAVYRNWSTPSAMVRLLRTADEKELFSNKELKDFLWQTMIDTETGANKLKGMLPAKTVVGHKTGSSDRNADGMKTADNDAGLVILPDGRKYYIAAFVMDSYETDEDNANIIARISRMVYDAMR